MTLDRGRAAKTASAEKAGRKIIEAPAVSTVFVATKSPWV